MTTIRLLKNQKIILGVNNNYTKSISENFNNTPTVNSTAFYLSPNFTIGKKLSIITSIREELYKEKWKPITYSINGKFNFYKNYYFTASFSKNYRTPNFNDLYWAGNAAKGNPNLEDEYGFSKDVGMGFKTLAKKLVLSSNLSFYLTDINNQIIWSPKGQNWSPDNMKLVKTKGVEFLFSLKYNIKKTLQAYYNLTYAYTDAMVKEKGPNESEDILNKQLIYIPYYQSNNSVGLIYKTLSLDINFQYVDYQFTRPDNLDWIQPYFLTDIATQYIIKQKKYDLSFSGRINNIFNVTYEVRQWYPMPRMNYELGIKLIIK